MRRFDDEAGARSQATPETGGEAPAARVRDIYASVPPRFAGPPGVANGGIVVGLMARALGSHVEVTLRRPTPLARPLRLRVESRAEGVRAELRDLDASEDRGLLAEGRRAPVRLPIPVAPDFEEARRARDGADVASHPYPDCFVCGPARAGGDGLGLVCGPLESCGPYAAVAAPFVADSRLVDRHGFVEARFVWAALDCPGAHAVFRDGARPLLLAQMAGALEARPRAAERCVVIGWRVGRQGRKHETGTALLGAGGRVLGRARQLWIEPR